MDRLEAQRAREILDRVRSVTVAVIGDLMLDVYLRGGASRISPEAPVPVVRIADDWRALGGAANVAANLVGLGARTAMVGIVGRDTAARELLDAAAHAGIEPGGVLAVDGRPTTVKTRVLVGHQQVARYDREVEDELAGDPVDRLCDAVEQAAGAADALVLEDYDKGVLVAPVIETALDAARRRRIPVVVDPKARHFFAFRGATVFKPNLPELAAALRAPVRPDDAEWMQTTRRHLQCDNLLLTLGAEGMALATEEDGFLRVPAAARSVYDVSGAGDTVSAVVAAALAAGATVDESAILATHAAGVEVGKAGVVTVAPEEIMDSIERRVAAEQKT